MPKIAKTTFENVRLIFKNFAGKEDQFNAEGNRVFSVVIDEDVAQEAAALGWNVKNRPPREEGESPLFYIPVTVSYKKSKPRVVMITQDGKRTNLDEDSIEVLDFAYITNADVTLYPYAWSVGAKAGHKAYLEALYVTIEQDELERKYSNLDEH